MNELPVEGCTPEPLMGYLKALGVLRLVSEQKDATARGRWSGGSFALTTALTRGELFTFFRDEYKPTPLLAPWNGGSGFYEKLDLDKFIKDGKTVAFKSRDVVDAIKRLEAATAPRFAQYRSQITETKRALAALARRVNFATELAEPLALWGTNKKKAKADATKVLNGWLLFRSGNDVFGVPKDAKDEFVSALRGKVLTDDGLGWLDAALGMRTGQKKNRTESPTLGSGGNIGNSDFSARFAQLLPEVVALDTDGETPENSKEWLDAALFATPAADLTTTAVDQFDPGKAGGANGTVGMMAAPTLNPWDYVLMMEGALALSGNTSRRFGAGRAAASFPFVVASSSVGHGSIGTENTRGEAWLPLWSGSAAYGEVKALLNEGRAEVGRTRAASGLTFAQAVAGLGVDRGIASFVRYEFQERLGQSYIATPVGRFDVPNAPVSGIELVRALNPTLDALRRASDDIAPARFGTALRRIDAAIFEFCKFGGEVRLATILAALGAAERELAVGGAPPDKRRVRRPLGGLSAEWLSAADDGSAEFRLARGLAYLHGGAKGMARVRRYLEPVERTGNFWKWCERGGHVVWGNGSVARNLGAVLARRLMDAEKNAEVPETLGSRFPVPLADVAAFLGNETDDAKLEDLLWGLSLVDEPKERSATAGEVAALPRTYALLKLTLLPDKLRWAEINDRRELCPSRGDESGVSVRTDAAVLAKLRAGDVNGACEVAVRRLRSAGFVPVGTTHTLASEIDWETGAPPAERMLAALLFPVPAFAPRHFAELVLRIPTDSH